MSKVDPEGRSQHVTPVGGNVFVDLGFPPDEAAQLLAESKARIAATLASQRVAKIESREPE